MSIPTAFFGHSMGALISFELARFFRRRFSINTDFLFVSAYQAPQLTRRGQNLSRLTDKELLQELRQPHDATIYSNEYAELIEIMLPTIRADLRLCEQYEYVIDDPLDCPIAAFGGIADGDVSEQELQAWQMHTRSSFRLCMVPGDHFFLHSNLKYLLSAISADLLPIL
jgi:medium-chain acyl-[acyl-carrier-protein] hydrolase